YGLTEGLYPKTLRRFTKWAVDRCAGLLPDHLPAALRSRAELLPLHEAVSQIHYPDSEVILHEARRRLAFDELLLIQLGMLTRRANWQDGPSAPALPTPASLIFADSAEVPGRIPDEAASVPSGSLWPLDATCFERSLPFRFTEAQRRAIREILADLARPRP